MAATTMNTKAATAPTMSTAGDNPARFFAIALAVLTAGTAPADAVVGIGLVSVTAGIAPVLVTAGRGPDLLTAATAPDFVTAGIAPDFVMAGSGPDLLLPVLITRFDPEPLFLSDPEG